MRFLMGCSLGMVVRVKEMYMGWEEGLRLVKLLKLGGFGFVLYVEVVGFFVRSGIGVYSIF